MPGRGPAGRIKPVSTRFSSGAVSLLERLADWRVYWLDDWLTGRPDDCWVADLLFWSSLAGCPVKLLLAEEGVAELSHRQLVVSARETQRLLMNYSRKICGTLYFPGDC